MKKHHYFLIDKENNNASKPITLKEMERDRNNTNPPKPYHIRSYEDVIGADMFEFYSEIGYELKIK